MDSQKGKCTMLSKQRLLQSDLKKNGVWGLRESWLFAGVGGGGGREERKERW